MNERFVLHSAFDHNQKKKDLMNDNLKMNNSNFNSDIVTRELILKLFLNKSTTYWVEESCPHSYNEPVELNT